MFLPSNITLQFGDSGDFVSELQRRLALVDCHPEDQVNGFYDGVTVNSVTRFQGMNGIHADGVAGPETLRLLNGMASGGSAATDPKEEEVTQAAAGAAMLDTYMLAETAHADPSLLSPGGVAEAAATVEHTPSLIAEPQPYPQPSPPPPGMSVSEQMIREDALREPGQDRQLTTHELLMAQLHRAAAAHTPPADAPPQAHGRDAVATAPAAPEKPVSPVHEEQGVVGKTIRFTNSMLQRIADYLEAKLPPSVLREVQQTGQVMASRGVQETAIPTGPEIRGPEPLPARGPEQQQTMR